MKPDDLAEGRRLLAKATPGEWTYVTHDNVIISNQDSRLLDICPRSNEDVSAQKRSDNAALIVWLRNNAAALLDALAEAERDAGRGRWLLSHMNIAADEPGEWTCWLALDCIPYRWDPARHDTAELLDALVARFPLNPGTGEAGR